MNGPAKTDARTIRYTGYSAVSNGTLAKETKILFKRVKNVLQKLQIIYLICASNFGKSFPNHLLLKSTKLCVCLSATRL